jgi:hypothetical protein
VRGTARRRKTGYRGGREHRSGCGSGRLRGTRGAVPGSPRWPRLPVGGSAGRYATGHRRGAGEPASLGVPGHSGPADRAFRRRSDREQARGRGDPRREQGPGRGTHGGRARRTGALGAGPARTTGVSPRGAGTGPARATRTGESGTGFSRTCWRGDIARRRPGRSRIRIAGAGAQPGRPGTRGRPRTAGSGPRSGLLGGPARDSRFSGGRFGRRPHPPLPGGRRPVPAGETRIGPARR